MRELFSCVRISAPLSKIRRRMPGEGGRDGGKEKGREGGEERYRGRKEEGRKCTRLKQREEEGMKEMDEVKKGNGGGKERNK